MEKLKFEQEEFNKQLNLQKQFVNEMYSDITSLSNEELKYQAKEKAVQHTMKQMLVKAQNKIMGTRTNLVSKLQEENMKILRYLGFTNDNLMPKVEVEPVTNSTEYASVKSNKPFGNFGYNEHLLRNENQFTTEQQQKTNCIIFKVKPVIPQREKVDPVKVSDNLPEWSQKCFDFYFFDMFR